MLRHISHQVLVRTSDPPNQLSLISDTYHLLLADELLKVLCRLLMVSSATCIISYISSLLRHSFLYLYSFYSWFRKNALRFLNPSFILFFTSNLLTSISPPPQLNKDKSGVLVMGPRFGATLFKQVFGIKVKRPSKYLGLVYNWDLSFNHSIRLFEPKINYIRYRLFRMLRITDFRTRYNLWQLFVIPRIRIQVSTVGMQEH